MSSEEKTEEPTEQRKKKSRQEGQIPRTPDVATWGGLFLASILIPMTVSSLAERIRALMALIATTIKAPTADQAVAILKVGIKDSAIIAAPICIGLFAFGIAAAGAQGGLRPAGKMFKPQFSRMNPVSGLKRAFGGVALWEAAKAIAKTAIIGTVLYATVKDLVPALLTAGSIPLLTLLSAIADAAMGLFRAAAGAGLVLAGADYAMARRRIGKQIKMTKQEVKEEHRRSEGDPQLKSAIRGKPDGDEPPTHDGGTAQSRRGTGESDPCRGSAALRPGEGCAPGDREGCGRRGREDPGKSRGAADPHGPGQGARPNALP